MHTCINTPYGMRLASFMLGIRTRFAMSGSFNHCLYVDDLMRSRTTGNLEPFARNLLKETL